DRMPEPRYRPGNSHAYRAVTGHAVELFTERAWCAFRDTVSGHGETIRKVRASADVLFHVPAARVAQPDATGRLHRARPGAGSGAGGHRGRRVVGGKPGTVKRARGVVRGRHGRDRDRPGAGPAT